MDTPSPAWLPFFITLAAELTVVVAVSLALRFVLKSAPWRRTVWQVTLVSLALITLVEVSGVGRSAWTWAASRLRESQTAAADVRSRTIAVASPNRLLTSSATSPLLERSETVAAPVAVLAAPEVIPENVAWWPGVLWLAGFTLLGLRVMAVRALFARFQRVRQGEVFDPALAERLQAMARRMGLRRPVRVTCTTGLAGPIAFGIFRPCVSLPVDFQERFSHTQQEAMLAHELAHLAAGDPAWHLVGDLVTALLWWHPLAWWARRQLRSASETAADEASLLVENGPHALAECLVTLGGRLARTPSFGGLGVAGDDYRSGLGRRVKRLLSLNGQCWRPRRRPLGWICTGCCPLILALGVLGGTSWAQPRQAKAETLSQSFQASLIGMAWSSILQVSLNNNDRGAVGIAPVETERIDWQPWSQAAVAQARAEGRPVLVHFTADWSVTAQSNEKTSLEIPSVREKLRSLGAVALRADCTRPSDIMTAELRTHQRAGVPLTLVYAPDATAPAQVLPALLTPELVLQALEQTLQPPSRAVDSSKPADAKKNDAPSLILQGKTLLEAGKLAEAQDKLKAALKLDPANNAAAHYLALAEAPQTTTPKAGGVPLPGDLPLLGKLFATNAPDKESTTPQATTSSTPEANALHTRWFKVDSTTMGANLRELMGTNASVPPEYRGVTLQKAADPKASGNGEFRGVTLPKTVPSKAASSPESVLADLRNVLAATGVDLSPPKTLFFNDRLGQLLVRATLSDLDAIETLIQAVNTSPPQVVIDVRFCEITEEDGKGLGFDWLLGNLSGNKGNAAAAKGEPASLPGLSARADRNTSVPGDGTVTGILTDPQFRVVLRALEQRRSVNLLTAPKVTTLSGRQAQIKTVDIRYIVTDLDFNTNGTSGAIPAGGSAESIGIQPIAQPFELGPIIDLVPFVAADGFTIHLTVIATIKEFVGYDNKDGFVATLRNAKSEPQTSPTPLPIFRLRQVVTSAVVWDGQTLVLLGGSMTYEEAKEKTALGFSGQKGATRLLLPAATARQKKSLLVFVTPTIIDPAGNRVHSPEDLPIRKSSVPPQKAATVK